MSRSRNVPPTELPKERLLSSPRAKIARADEHLDALYRETDSWGDGDPFAVMRESNADGSVHLFRLRFKSQPDVWRWALILGDALHNLRCALDHMVYALAIAQTGKAPPEDDEKLAFPICSEPKFFQNQRWRIASLNECTQTAIEKAQPYNRAKPGRVVTPLWFLAQLDDIDKHRLSHLSPAAALPDDLFIGARRGTYKVEWNHRALVDGAPILRVTLNEPDPHVRVNINATCAVVLDFEDLPPLSLYWTTRHIRREVVVVCRYLSRYFPT